MLRWSANSLLRAGSSTYRPSLSKLTLSNRIDTTPIFVGLVSTPVLIYALQKMGNSNKRMVDGVTYDIRQSMVHPVTFEPESWKVRIITKYLYSYFALPIVTTLAPLMYLLVLNSKIAARMVSEVMAYILPWLDRSLFEVKQELTKDVHGNVLDVGNGVGDWLNYLHNASSITELEPHQERLPLLQKAVNEFRQKAPSTNIQILNKTIDEMDAYQAYDVSSNEILKTYLLL
jgi:hypothetical protein